MIAFFTTVGFGASVSLLRVGGPAVAVFLVLATIAAIAQNVVERGWRRSSASTRSWACSRDP